MIYVGVDPGASSGGIAAIDYKTGDVRMLKLADATDRDVLDFLAPGAARAVIERVHAMPKQGVSSSFKFGVSYGGLCMALTAARIPFERVTPAKWQQAMACRTKGDKNVSKRRAQDLHPGIRVTHWNADALLLATYAGDTHVRAGG